MSISPAGGFGWAQAELRAPLAHEKRTPRAEAEAGNVLVDPHGRPLADVTKDNDLALRPSRALLVCVQQGLRAGAFEVVKAAARRAKRG